MDRTILLGRLLVAVGGKRARLSHREGKEVLVAGGNRQPAKAEEVAILGSCVAQVDIPRATDIRTLIMEDRGGIRLGLQQGHLR